MVATYVTIGTTDARYFSSICKNVYRFIPYIMRPQDLKRFHGINERIALADFEVIIKFYYQLIINSQLD